MSQLAPSSKPLLIRSTQSSSRSDAKDLFGRNSQFRTMGNDATSATRGEDVSHLSAHPGVIPLLCLVLNLDLKYLDIWELKNYIPWYLKCNGSWKYWSESFNIQNTHTISWLCRHFWQSSRLSLSQIIIEHTFAQGIFVEPFSGYSPHNFIGAFCDHPNFQTITPQFRYQGFLDRITGKCRYEIVDRDRLIMLDFRDECR